MPNDVRGRRAVVLEVGRTDAMVLLGDGEVQRVALNGRTLVVGQRIWLNRNEPLLCPMAPMTIGVALLTAGSAVAMHLYHVHAARPQCG